MARLFSFCSSVVNRNEWGLTSSRYACTIGAKKKVVKFFFKLFFRRVCRSLGVGRWVSVGGCVGVGRRVWVRGAAGWGGLDGGGMGMGRAGWRLTGWEERIGLPGRPHPGFGLPARV